MSSEVIDILIPVLVVSFVLGAFYFSIQYEKKRRAKVTETYQRIAHTFQLTFIPEHKASFFNYNYPQIQGNIEDVRIRLMSYITGGKNKTTYTNLAIASPGNLPTMKIVNKGVFQKIATTFGAQDIVIGNPELDQHYVFKCADEDRFLKAIDSEVQQLLLHLQGKIKGALVVDKHNTFIYEFVNHVDDEVKRDDFEKVLLLMLKIERNLR